MIYYIIDLNKTLKINLLNITDLKPSGKHSDRNAPEYIAYFVINGTLYLTENGDEIKLNKGDMHIFTKGEHHKPTKPSDCLFLFVHFDSDGIKTLDMTDSEFKKFSEAVLKSSLDSYIFGTGEYSNMNIALPKDYHFSDNREFDYFIKSFKELKLDNMTQKSLNYKYRISSKVACLFNEIMQKIAFPEQKTTALVNKVASFINNNYMHNFTRFDIENVSGYSFDYTNKLFKKNMNTTIFKYKTQLQLSTAKMKLEITSDSIKKIAMDVGINDVFYFSKLFSLYIGVSPSKYRQIKLGV